jgi:ABC-type arginine/histidine transport system permease subunit
MLQASALASVITIFDITGVAGAIANRTFAFYEMYLMAAALYLALTYLIAWGFRKVEFRLSGHLRERPGVAPAARMLAAPGTH